MLRARLTEAEHHALTVIAAQTKTPVADLVAAALRVAYPRRTRRSETPA
jgi:hypothetical protein